MKSRVPAPYEPRLPREVGIFYAALLPRYVLQAYLSAYDEYELLRRLKDDGRTGKAGALIHTMWAFKHDRSSVWTWIERALGRSRVPLALELVVLANAMLASLPAERRQTFDGSDLGAHPIFVSLFDRKHVDVKMSTFDKLERRIALV